jgi:hypothetical protein
MLTPLLMAQEQAVKSEVIENAPVKTALFVVVGVPFDQAVPFHVVED